MAPSNICDSEPELWGQGDIVRGSTRRTRELLFRARFVHIAHYFPPGLPYAAN